MTSNDPNVDIEMQQGDHDVDPSITEESLKEPPKPSASLQTPISPDAVNTPPNSGHGKKIEGAGKAMPTQTQAPKSNGNEPEDIRMGNNTHASDAFEEPTSRSKDTVDVPAKDTTSPSHPALSVQRSQTNFRQATAESVEDEDVVQRLRLPGDTTDSLDLEDAVPRSNASSDNIDASGDIAQTSKGGAKASKGRAKTPKRGAKAEQSTPSSGGQANNVPKAGGPLPTEFFANMRENDQKKKKNTQAQKERNLGDRMLAQIAQKLYQTQPTNHKTAAQTSSSPAARIEDRNIQICHSDVSLDEERGSVEDDSEDEEEKLNLVRKEYAAKKAQGTQTLEDAIKLAKAVSASECLRRKQNEDIQAQLDDEAQQFKLNVNQSLFLSDEENEVEWFDDSNQFQPSNSEDPSRRSRRAPPTRKAPALPRISRVEYDDSLEAGLAPLTAKHAKKQRKTGSKVKKVKTDNAATGSKRKRGKKQDTEAGAEPPAKKKRGRPKAQRAAAEGHISSLAALASGDVLADGAAAANDSRSQPILDDKNKSRALLSLVSRIPLEDQQYAQMDKKALDEATKKLTWRRAQIAPNQNGWKIKGMTAILKNFQLLGLGRLRELERRAGQPKGGIIADSMGLGKTVSMLANMVDGEAQSGDPNRATLVVVPPAVLHQWMREIRQHLEDGMLNNVMIYNGNDNYRDELRTLQHADIVLTTYHTLRRSYPKNDPPKEMTPDEQVTWFKQKHAQFRGALHRVSWLRVVLDECNAIKNYKSQTAIAACGLTARHRWLASGTILTNDISEFYSYFKFLKAPFTGSLDLFTQNFLKDGPAQNRLFEILKTLMIRRTHKDRLMGAPLVKLPSTEMHTNKIDFSSIENEIYDIVCKRCEKSVRRYSKLPGILPRDVYMHAFLRLLLLRQLTGHFQSCAATLHKFVTKKDMAEMLALCTAEKAHENEEMVQRLKLTLHEVESNMSRASSVSGASESTESDDDSESQGQSVRPELRKPLESQQGAAAIANALCAACHMVPGEDAWDIDCGHVICDRCLEELGLETMEAGFARSTCPACQHTFTAAPRNNSGRGNSGRPKKGRPVKAWRKEGFFHSSKTRAIKAAVTNWIEEDPNIKVVIYTQFLIMGDIICKVCEDEGWGYVPYNGTMDLKAREKAIKSFQEGSHTRVLVASLKAGGVGLNLTQATRVILVDLYWNYALEEQAFCRVFRIGQKQHTIMHRFAINQSIDERLLQLQARKKREIDQVLNGTQRTTIQAEDLFKLFGLQLDGSMACDGGDTPFLVPNEAVGELVEELRGEL